jgi:hypothetical protein
MRWAILGGAETIEHGDGATRKLFKLMAEHYVALYPTLAPGNHPGPREAGMLANLIAMDGDPTADISVLRSNKFVMKDGVVFNQ